MHADAIVRHNGAWCRINETQATDTSWGSTECVSLRGIVGLTNHRDFTTQRCGDVPYALRADALNVGSPCRNVS